MGRFQVFKKHRILGTEQDCFVSSFTEEERRGLGDDEDAALSMIAAHVHDVDEIRTPLFKSAEDVQSELSTGQIADLAEAILEASGGKAGARFPDGEGETGSPGAA